MKGNQADLRLPHGNAEGQEMMDFFLWSYDEKSFFPSNLYLVCIHKFHV